MKKGIIINEEFNMNQRKLTPQQMCQLYACMAWHGMSYAEALKILQEKTYEEVEAITYTNDSIQTAISGIEKYKEALKTDRKYYAVMKILEEIHDKWVCDNAKKYNKDSIEQNPDLPKEQVDQRLFQHLPTALIGVEELANHMMFLEPFLHEQGIELGKMTNEPYGAFIPNNEISNVYSEYAEHFKAQNHINNITPNTIKEIIKDYEPLQNNTTDFGQTRADYLNEHAELLAKQVEAHNQENFVFQEDVENKTFSQMTDEELKQYVEFSIDDKKSFEANIISGCLNATPGANLEEALEAGLEFLKRHENVKNIDLNFNKISLNITRDAETSKLINLYDNEVAKKRNEKLAQNTLTTNNQ